MAKSNGNYSIRHVCQQINLSYTVVSVLCAHFTMKCFICSVSRIAVLPNHCLFLHIAFSVAILNFELVIIILEFKNTVRNLYYCDTTPIT